MREIAIRQQAYSIAHILEYDPAIARSVLFHRDGTWHIRATKLGRHAHCGLDALRGCEAGPEPPEDARCRECFAVQLEIEAIAAGGKR